MLTSQQIEINTLQIYTTMNKKTTPTQPQQTIGPIAHRQRADLSLLLHHPHNKRLNRINTNK
jgi:hypothetical protein